MTANQYIQKIILLSCFFISVSLAQLSERDKYSSQSSMPQSTTIQQQSQLPDKIAVQDGPVDPKEYVVGPGDVFNVSIWAATPLNFQVPVTPEGTIVIPTVNEVNIAGMTLDSARKIVLSEIRKKYITGNATFTLFVPRKFTVTVSGLVLNEGKYTVQATQRIDALLQSANDIALYKEKNLTEDPAKIKDKIEQILTLSSYRYIKVIRKNGLTLTADLTKYFATRNALSNPLLQDGDVVIVPPSNVAKDFVGVFGAVAKEGMHEFVEGDSLSTLLGVAGGFTSFADPARVIIARTTPEEKQIELKVNAEEIFTKHTSDILLQNGDRIVVAKKNSTNRGGVVSVEGEVLQPGSYPIIQDSTTLQEVIEKAGGFTKFALLSAGKILRLPADQYNKGISYRMLRKGSTSSEDTVYFNNEILLKNEGDIISADFKEIIRKEYPDPKITLRDGDRIIIPSKTNSVYVFGEVVNPGHVRFIQDKSIDYYLTQVGGLTDHAEDGDIRIVKAASKQWLLPSETTVEEGDYIWIPKEPYRPFTYYLTVYSQVFGIVGTIATLFLLITK